MKETPETCHGTMKVVNSVMVMTEFGLNFLIIMS